MKTDRKLKKYVPENSIKDLIRDNAMLLPALSRFDIAFGFGDVPIKQICDENNVDLDTFLCVCNLLSGYDYNASSISLNCLTAYLERAHSSFLDVELPDIKHHLIEAVNITETNEVALLLIKFFDDYVLEVRKHMEFENNVIFNYVSRLQAGEASADFNIGQYSSGHVDTASKLNELKDIFIHHYKQKDNTRLGKVLLSIIMCERDMLSHFEVESKLLIPAVRKLEKESMSSVVHNDSNTEECIETGSDSVVLLSEREKEIIRGVARGKVNKEIADDLCISVHTVATHRRNICNKLGIRSPAGLTVFAIIHHLVELDEVKPV